MGEMLSVKNINVYYGSIHAIKDVSFHVNEGEIVTLIGANGAGKSSAIRAAGSGLPAAHRAEYSNSLLFLLPFCGETNSP